MALSDRIFAFGPEDGPAVAKRVGEMIGGSIKPAYKQEGPAGKEESRVVKNPEPAQ